MRVLLLLACLLALPASAQTYGVSKFRNVWGGDLNKTCGSLALRPLPGNSPACTPSYSDEALAFSRFVYYSGEESIPTTATKDPAIETYSQTTFGHGAGGSALVFNRQDSTGAPPSCGGPATCFTYASALDSVSTCQHPSGAAGVRAVNSGAALAATRQDTVDAIATHFPTRTPPVELVAIRFDVLHWSALQIDGFDLDWLLTSSTAWSSFLAWADADSSGNGWTFSAQGAGTGGVTRIGKDEGMRYNDLIAARGGTPTDYVYYLTRPNATSIDPLAPNGVLADTNDDDYQNWYLDRIVEPVLAESGIRYYLLSNKIRQHKFAGGANRDNVGPLGSGGEAGTGTSFACHQIYADLAACVDAGNGCFTGDVYPSLNWAQYTAGQRKLAQKLIARGIPYAISTNGSEFVTAAPTTLDDPATTPSSPGAGQVAATGSYDYDGNDRNCSVPSSEDYPVGTSCELDDWRFITRNASVIWWTDNCAGCNAALQAKLTAWGKPYIRTSEGVSTFAGCLNAQP